MMKRPNSDGEDGVDVVEAIDAWIDETIDDLSDDELESILEILDAVSDSQYANLDADDVYDDDIDDLVELVGGDSDTRAYADLALRRALFGDHDQNGSEHDGAQNETDTHQDDLPDHIEVDGPPDDLDGLDELIRVDTEFDAEEGVDSNDFARQEIDDGAHADAAVTFDDLENLEDLEDIATFLDNSAGTPTDEPHGLVGEPLPGVSMLDDPPLDEDTDAVFLGDLVSAQTFDLSLGAAPDPRIDFLADVAKASATAELLRPVAAAPLRPFDDLGPAFLPDEASSGASPSPQRGMRVGQIVLPIFMIVGLAVFGFGMIQLINSLDASETDIATAAEATPVPTQVPTPDPADAAPTAEPNEAQGVVATESPTPAAQPDPEPRLGIRLVTGDVMLATFHAVGEPPTFGKLYDASDEEVSPARQITWLGGDLAIIDDDGNVLVVDPGDAGETMLVYEATGGLAEAAQVVRVGDLIAVRTVEGDINLTPSNERADPDILRVAWDGEEKGAFAIDMSATGDLVAFVLDNGNARLMNTDDDDSSIRIWKADPKPPVYNLLATEQGVLMGIGEGTISRYLLGDVEGKRFETVWDPPAEDEDQLPAAGYSAAGAQTAVVLVDGGIVLVDAEGETTTLWNSAVTEIRAFSAAGDDSHVLVLLETGSIVRIPLDPDEFIESIWDITDETLSAAMQLAVEPLS